MFLPDPSAVTAAAFHAAYGYDADRWSEDPRRTSCWGDGCHGVMTTSETGLCAACYREITGNEPNDLSTSAESEV